MSSTQGKKAGENGGACGYQGVPLAHFLCDKHPWLSHLTCFHTISQQLYFCA
jgi:hypothetical protein